MAIMESSDPRWVPRLTWLIVLSALVTVAGSALRLTHVLSDTTLVLCAVAYGGAVMVWGTRLFAKEWEVTFWEALLHLLRKRRP
jgi:hypothetical protein